MELEFSSRKMSDETLAWSWKPSGLTELALIASEKDNTIDPVFRLRTKETSSGAVLSETKFLTARPSPFVMAKTSPPYTPSIVEALMVKYVSLAVFATDVAILIAFRSSPESATVTVKPT